MLLMPSLRFRSLKFQLEKVALNIPRCQLQRLNLAEFITWKCWNDFPQRGEGLVEALRSLSLAHVGHASEDFGALGFAPDRRHFR